MRSCCTSPSSCFFFFFNDTATTEIYTLSLHDALPIFLGLVEAEVPEVVEQPSGLRDDFRVDPLDVPLQRIGRAEVVGRLVPQPGVPVPDGGESPARSRTGRWPCTRTRRCRSRPSLPGPG